MGWLNNRVVFLFRWMIIGAFLVILAIDLGHFVLVSDDLWFRDLTCNRSFGDAFHELYTTVNGRWSSHFIDLSAFYLLRIDLRFQYWIHLIFLFYFVASVAYFIKHMSSVQVRWQDAFTQAICWVALLFFFCWKDRLECFYWINGEGVYLCSIATTLFLLALLKKKSTTRYEKLLLWVLPFVIAGMYEISALVLMLSFISMDVKGKWKLVGGLAAGLLLNVIAPGMHARMGLLPEWNWLQAFRNTLHSMLLPLLDLPFLPLRILVLVLTFLLGMSSRMYIPVVIDWKGGSVLLVGIFLLYFLPCLTLSDITAARMQLPMEAILLAIVYVWGGRAGHKKKASFEEAFSS